MLERLSLEGKVIIITGGGTGLGREMVRHCARAGADLVIAARRPGPIEEAAEEVRQMGRRALAVPTDVTDPAQVNRMVERALEAFGHIDVLVNNAGIVREHSPKPIWEITDEEWQVGIAVNLSGAFYCSRAVARHMAERGKGRIINVSSGFGLRGMRDGYMYSIAKGGVLQLTRTLAFSLGRYGVTAVSLVPGFFPTETVKERGSLPRRADYIPVKRFGFPPEIGPAVVYLASDASSYFNGEMFILDGGALWAGISPTGYAPHIPLQEEA